MHKGLYILSLCMLWPSVGMPETSQPNGTLELLSNDAALREQAEIKLLEQRESLGAELLEQLRTSTPDPTYGSAYHRLVQMIGAYRFNRAAFELAKVIDYKLDESSLDYVKLTAGDYYPAAAALAKLNDQYMIEAVIQQLTKKTDDKRDQLLLWVLYKAFGDAVTDAILADQQARLGERYPALKTLLKKGEELVVIK